MISGSNAGFQSAAGQIRRGEPELSGMASSRPISQTRCPLDEAAKDA
jgi:hypothetical protein